MNKRLHQTYCQSGDRLKDWYCEQLKDLPYPIYSSYDIRDSGHKVAPVDANIFPAGFNNICPTDVEHASDLFDRYFGAHYKKQVQNILLVTEEHTRNPFYWNNVDTLVSILKAAGKQVTVAVPRHLDAPLHVATTSQKQIEVQSGEAGGKNFDFVISNNDFSVLNPDWSLPPELLMNPPRELGWYQRQKATHFDMYNQVAHEFAELTKLDPINFTVRTELFEHFDLDNESATKEIAERADKMIAEIQREYASKKIESEPFLFIKNNAGTYGLGVIRIRSGADLLEMSSRNRKKMQAAKGGRQISAVILQEGIPSTVHVDTASAEPVMYMIGQELAGGFLRAHPEKNSSESLNAAGAIYKRLCVSDLLLGQADFPLENVYGWAARLGLIAIAREIRAMKVQFPDFQTSAEIKKPCASNV